MQKDKSNPLADCKSTDELIELFDAGDFGDDLENMPEAHFEVDLKKRTHLFTMDDDIAGRVTEIARKNHIPSQTLVNTWLKEKIQQLG